MPRNTQFPDFLIEEVFLPQKLTAQEGAPPGWEQSRVYKDGN